MIRDLLVNNDFETLYDFSNNNEVLYLILISMALSIVFVSKNDKVSLNVRRCLISFFSVGSVLLLFDLIMNRIVSNYKWVSSESEGNFWLMILVWPIMALAYLLIVLNTKKWLRIIMAVLCVAAAMGFVYYPSKLAIERFQKYDYILRGSYTESDNARTLDAVYEDHTLTIGQKGSGKFIEGFDIELDQAEDIDVSLTYRAHIKNIGWYDWSPEGTNVTYNPDYAIDAVQFMLYGKDACRYKVEYRIAFAGEDWQEWQSEGILVGIIDTDNPIEALQIRLVYSDVDAANTWTVTQYSPYSDEPGMFYIIRNNNDGTMIAIDGGGDHFSNQVRSVINLYGGHVDYWFITHDDYWHAGTLNGIQESPNGIEVDNVYVMSSEVTDSFEIDGLQIQIFEGSMLKISGAEDSILFLGDNYCDMYDAGSLSAEYVEVELLEGDSIDIDLSGEMRPQAVFLDSPMWMINTEGYGASELFDMCNDNGVDIHHMGDAPNSISFD